MIKYFKYFLTLFVISLGIINFSNAWTYWGGTTGVNNDPIFGNWLIYQPVGDREYLNNYGLLVDEDGDFDTFYNTGYSQLVLYFPRSGQPYQYGQVYYGRIDGKLYYYGDYAGELNNNRYTTQGFIQNFCKTTKDLLLDVNNGPYNHCDYDLPAEEFYSQPHNFVNIYSMSSNGSLNAFVTATYRTFCLEESNGVDVYCWSCSMYDNQNQTWSPYNCNSGLSGSLNFNITDFNDVFNIPFDFSPFGFSSNNNGSISYTGTFEDEIDSTIAYYEYRYNWNENMCYVGTNDLEHSFRYFIGQGVPYEFGSGATLYQLYYSIYSGFGNNKIRNLGSFINSWVINYGMVYDTVGEDDIRYVARYNGPDTNVTILYTGYTNELFLGNLGAIYNMASVLYNSYMQESTMGEEVAYYCDIKLNYNNYKNGSLSFTGLQDLVTPGIIERVGDYISRDMPGSTGYIQPDMGSGSIWNDIVSSGYAIPEDINPTNLFKDYYDKMNNLVRNFVPVSGTGIIPDWILFPMLFLIFYRIIRH